MSGYSLPKFTFQDTWLLETHPNLYQALKVLKKKFRRENTRLLIYSSLYILNTPKFGSNTKKLEKS
jgi:hypothetical protein